MDPAGVEPASGNNSSKNAYMLILLISLYRQSQPIIGVRWTTTIFDCLSSLSDFFQSSSVMGDDVTRVTRSLH